MQDYDSALLTKIRTREALAHLEREEMPAVVKKIAKAASKGMFWVTLPIQFDSTVEKLKELGYRVTRDNDFLYYYTISWED